MQLRQQFDDQRGPIGVDRVQGVRELAVTGREVLEDEREPARVRVELGAVTAGDTGQLSGELAVEASLCLLYTSDAADDVIDV